MLWYRVSGYALSLGFRVNAWVGCGSASICAVLSAVLRGMKMLGCVWGGRISALLPAPSSPAHHWNPGRLLSRGGSITVGWWHWTGWYVGLGQAMCPNLPRCPMSPPAPSLLAH